MDDVVAWLLVLKYPTPSTAPRQALVPRRQHFNPLPEHTRIVKAGELFIFNDNDSEDEDQFTYESIRFVLAPRQIPNVVLEGTPNRVPFHRVEYYHVTLTAVFGDDTHVEILNERVVLDEMMELAREGAETFFGTQIGPSVNFTVEVRESFAVEIVFNSVPVPLIVRLHREHLQRQPQAPQDSPPPLPPPRRTSPPPRRTSPPWQHPPMPR